MSELQIDWNRICERIGLDWFIMLTGRPAFEIPPEVENLPELRQAFAKVKDDNGALDDAVEYCTYLLKREDDREEKIESKAQAIIGFMGIATAFSLGFADLLLDRAQIGSTWAMWIVALLYVIVVFSFLWTIFLASKAVDVFGYRFTYPSADSILDLEKESLQEVKRERAASLLRSINQNSEMVRKKATYLGGAQLWFRNSIILLMILMLVFAIVVLLVPVPTNGSSVPAQSTVGPSQTPQLAPSLTPAMSTVKPTVMPIDTPTTTATATSTVSPTTTLTPGP